jgi:hypothetical protein
MRWIGKALHLGEHAALWRVVRPARPIAGGGWFLGRFLDASSVVARRWDPTWASRHRIFGCEVGAWILAVFWLTVPLALALKCLRRLFW